MPTLDRRLLAWINSDTEDEAYCYYLLESRGLAVDGGGSYDRCASLVDDVLVPAGADDEDGGGRPGTSQACAAAGLVAVGCLCAYLAWRHSAAWAT